jgi:hypothetical protein
MMQVEVGNRDLRLWLIGDSNPAQWETRLLTPLDPRHPTRHNIWTPVLDEMQDGIYRASRQRIDTSGIYVRNALAEAGRKPAPTETQWSAFVEDAVDVLRKLIETHRPMVLFCFGAFAFEFVRRTLGEKPLHNYSYWSAKKLGTEFRKRITEFEPGTANAVPMLHAVIARGRFIEAHEQFCEAKGANYFEVVGAALGGTMLRFGKQLPIWID